MAAESGAVTEGTGGARVAVRLTPRASREQITGFKDGSLQVRVTAPPAENRANQALCKLLSRELGVAKSKVSVVSGGKSRDKVVEFAGLVPDELRERLTAFEQS